MSAGTQRGLTRRKALWATGIAIALGVVVFLFGRLVLNAREAARFTSCRNNLKQITLALHNYHDTFDCFPPAVVYGPDGKPWHSWRVLLNPYLEGSPFWSRYRLDEPWDGPNNSKLAAELKHGMPVLHCPSDDADPNHTSYVAIVGDGTMWPGDGVATLDDVADREGEVIQIVEVAGSGIHWMEPRDLSFDTMSFTLNGEGESIESRHMETGWLQDGKVRFNAAFVDGHVEPITADTPPGQLRSMLLRNDPDEAVE